MGAREAVRDDVEVAPARGVGELRIADQVGNGGRWLPWLGSATHYHATRVKPGWRRTLKKVSQVGRHVFYRLKRMPEDLLKGEGTLVAVNGGGPVYH